MHVDTGCFQITDKAVGGTIQGLSLDVSTAGSIAHSLQALREGCADKAVMEVVTLLATKPMKVCAPCWVALHAGLVVGSGS